MRLVPSVKEYQNVNDAVATQIDQEFATTTTEYSNVIELDLYISEHLTESGAKIIAHRLKHQSYQIKRLGIFGRGVHGRVLQPLLEVAVQCMEELRLAIDLNNDIAKKLREVLLMSLDDDRATTHHHALQTLWLQFGSNFKLEAAQHLGVGLRHAKVKCLELQVFPGQASLHVIRTICLAAAESAETLGVHGLIDDALANEVSDALIANTGTLKSLRLELPFRFLSPYVAARLANAVSRSRITHLDMKGLMSNGIAVESDAFFEGVTRSPTICHLTVGRGFGVTPGFVQCLASIGTLEIHPWMEVQDIPASMSTLKTTNAPHLTSLVLGRQLMREPDVLAVCGALQHLTSLVDLTVCCMLAFDDQNEGVETNGIDARPHIRATGAEQLMLAVASHPSLAHLTLTGDEMDIGFAGLAMIGTHLPNMTTNKLKTLTLCNLSDCYETTDKRPCVQRAFQRACQALVAGVQANWHLHTVRLNETNFPLQIIDQVNFYLDLNKSLGRDLLHETDDRKVPMGLWCHVLAKCGNTDKASLAYYFLREQPILLLAAGKCHQCKLNGKTHDGSSLLPAGSKRHREE